MLTAKISEKNTLQGFQRGYLQQKQQIQFFFVFPIYKRVKYKNMSLISVKGYTNAKVHAIQVKKIFG